MLLLFFADLLKWDLCEGSGGSSDESESVGSGGVYRSSGGDFIFHRIEKVSNQQGVKRMEKMYLDIRSCRFGGGVRHLRYETVVCGIGYACFTMALLQFIDVVRTRE